MKVLYFVSFLAGAVVGATAGILATKKHFEDIAQEEIDSVKEVFGNAEHEEEEHTEDIQVPNEKPELSKYMDIIKKEGYKNYSNSKQEPTTEEPVAEDTPYEIDDAEFGEIDGYSQHSWTYFSDGVLCEDHNEPLSQDEIDSCVGLDFVNAFFDNEDADSIYIRNEVLMGDYEILKDLREYRDVVTDRE